MSVAVDAKHAPATPSVAVPSTTDDEYEGELPIRIDPATIRELSVVRPGVSVLHIAMEWSLIFAVAFLCHRYFHPVLYVVTLAFIGARQHALIVLAHDAAHWRLFRNRAVNDWVGELALAWPFVFFTMQSYRRNHLPHHRHINSERDPDWVRKQNAEWEFPMTWPKLLGLLFLDVIGVGFIKFLVVALRLPRASSTSSAATADARIFRVARLGFLIATIVTISLLQAWTEYLLFWVVPYVTWMQVCFHVRSIAEHFAIRGRTGVFAQTRTVIPNWFERMFVLSKHVNYHLEHHLFPSVPFHRLPELHRLLMEQPAFRKSAHLTRGYLAVLRECTGR